MLEYCTGHAYDALLAQWDEAKNAPLTPETVTYGSHRKVWWICKKGHAWQAAIYTRTGAQSGCPYCAGKKAYPGGNDLASQRSDLAAQWHPIKNGTLTAVDVTLGSHRRVWWICEKNHTWQAMVKTRVSGSGCPVCANRILCPGENDLAMTHPDLTQQWHPMLNGALTPRDVLPGTHRKVWWVCEKGHAWQAAIYARTGNGEGCPVCAGKLVIPGENDLLSRFPEIARQWHPNKNAPLTPREISPYSNKRVWWRCSLGHDYQAVVGARTVNGSGCPYCMGRKVLPGFNDLASLKPKLAAQWHPTLNGSLTPEMVTLGSHKKVWWVCSAGHTWQAAIYARAGPQKNGCPVCAGRVKPERAARCRAAMDARKKHDGKII